MTPQPIYDTCEHCQLQIRPGESHGVIEPGADGQPRLVCKILKLEMKLDTIPVEAGKP